MRSTNNYNTKRAIVQSVALTAIFFMTGILVATLIPFPYWLVVFIAIIVVITAVIGTTKICNWMVGAFNDDEQDGNNYADITNNNKIRVNFYCSNCGKKHSETFCPNCGSKVKRVAF